MTKSVPSNLHLPRYSLSLRAAHNMGCSHLRSCSVSLLYCLSTNMPLFRFLGGLSLHLNNLIASCMANYNWPFGTLPFGLFGSNLDTRDLETYPRTYSGHF